MKNKIILLLTFGLFLGYGCDKGFEELNTNPNEPVSVQSGLLAGDVIRVASNTIYSTFVGGDMGSCWSQQFAKVQYNNEARYIPRESIIESTWKNIYIGVIEGATDIQKVAIEENNEAMQGLGLVMQAYGFSLLTDMYGSIPFSEAIQPENTLTPAYNTQEEVYNGVLAMLDEANTLLGSGNGAILASSDILYGGDASKWQQFANSLKFRCLMRISAKKDVSSELQEIASNRNVFGSNDDEAKLIYLGADPNANPIYETVVFGTRAEWKVNTVLVDMLTGFNDPRLPVYAQLNDAGEYRGKPSGYSVVPDTWNFTNVSAIGAAYLEAEAPGYFMSYAELQFLMAEAAEKGYISGDAATYYNEAIYANFMSNGLSAEAYDAYIAQGNVAYSSSNGMERIGNQKWLALFCQGVESWTEQRRTGYPVLELAIDPAPGVTTIPMRYTYPDIEQSVNSDNYNTAVNAQGEDLLTTKVWWMD
ncbi:MAG: SusD/RagB family nutrient-binding outer membrane lipoprotein [Chitinophagales bacterium]